MSLEASWRCCATSHSLQRSSHNLDVVGGRYAYIFGGELEPRKPRDNLIFEVNLTTDDDLSNNLREVSTSSAKPLPRVGAASAVLNDKIYVFSGRGGEEMTPLEECGAMWAFNVVNSSWSLVKPDNPSDPFPQARSYHCATSTTDGTNLIYVHAGCPNAGRLSDLWSFNVDTLSWTRHADAPAPQRGGPSVAFAHGALYRMNGFDGKTEQGGTIDIYDPLSNSWSSKLYTADGKSGPAPRSVGTLLPVLVKGKCMLVTLFGEGDPSALGHAGAGKMFDDIWAYDIYEEKWLKVETNRDSHPGPAARGWFDASTVNDSTILISGGLAEDNERLSDCWLLTF